MLSFNESNRPVALIEGGAHHGKIVFAHETEDPAKRLPTRPSTLFRADEFAVGRSAPYPQDLHEIYSRLNMGDDYIEPRLAGQYGWARQQAQQRSFKELRLTGNAIFKPIPRSEERQREFCNVIAPSGAGKSTFVGNYADMYRMAFPDNRIFLFTSKKEENDPAYDGVVEPFDLEDFMEGEAMEPRHVADSLVIFDDVDTLEPKALREAVLAFKARLAETGRSQNVYMCVTSHLGMSGEKTRRDLNEANGFVIYPQLGSHYHNERLLRVYSGLDKEQIARVLAMPSRWAYINCKSFPKYVIGEHEMFLLTPSK